MRRLYDKSRICFSVIWIVAYCVLMSVGDSLSATFGIEKSVTLVFGIALSSLILLFLKKNKLFKDYGLRRSAVSAKAMLYYMPIFIMLTANFWQGAALNYSAVETVLYVLSMLCVGFLEEIIFRGLLFNAMKESNVKSAVIVSAVTFGAGHIINLINGSGAELVPNLLQVIYATAAGFMFVMIYYKSKSLIVCIASHGIFNATSAFANEANSTLNNQIITSILLTLIMGSYALYIAFTVKNADTKQ